MADLSQEDRAIIERAAGLLRLEAPAVGKLAGGSRNRCYRLTCRTSDVVVRIAGPGDEDYAVARDAESLSQRIAASQGLAPQLLLVDREAGFTVMQYAAGPVWSRQFAASPGGAARLGAWLRRLHAVAVPHDLHEVSFAANLEHYCAALESTSVAPALLDEARRIAQACDPGTQGVLCHNDLHHLNLVESPQGLLAVDWEYAGIGAPVMDLAGFVAYHDLGERSLAALLDAYDGARTGITRDDVIAARGLFEAVWWAWLELHHSRQRGEPPGDAAIRRRLARRLGAPPA